MRVSTVSQMREMDRTAIEHYGIAEEMLMENAGIAAYRVLSSVFEQAHEHILVVCGGGNNGGDGLVVARLAHSAGAQVRIVLLSEPEKFQGAAQRNYGIVRSLGVPMLQLETVAQFDDELETSHMVVDAIFGTGISRPVTGKYADVIQRLNDRRKPILSIDIPSGINGDTGQVMGVAVRATHTVTFGLPKNGNLLYPGYEFGGRLWVSHISFPPTLYDSAAIATATFEPVLLPARQPNGHKGTFGDMLFVAGAASYYGAPYFSAAAFMKAGGGYARLAAPNTMVPHLATKGSEIVFVPQAETASGSMSMDNFSELKKLASRSDFVVVGPGLSLDPEAQELVRALVATVDAPILIDGDGLTAIQGNMDLVRARRAPTILTPHPGEMSRLTALDIATIESDRVAVLRESVRDFGATIVLKGAHSLVGTPDGNLTVNLSGNSGMATAGSGDVLAGTIAGMMGLGLPAEMAARQGVFVHGLAGDLAAHTMGEDGITAQDILEALPQAMVLCRRGLPDELAQRYRLSIV